MKSTLEVLIPALVCCGLLALAAGCEDSAAKARDTAAVNIARASSAYEQASSSGLDPADPAVRPLLASILTSIGSMNGADPGQAAAAAMLSANIHRQLGTLDLLQAEQLESEHRLDRLIVHGVVDLVGELSALADAQGGFSGTDEQATLDRQRQAAAQALTDLANRLAELDVPIASLTAANDADTKQADQLKKEANVLYGESMTLGHYDGFPTREQAVERRRAAETLDRQIADRHSELEFTYEPERSLAQDRAAMNKALIADIDRAGADLKSFGELSANQAQVTRTAIDGFAADVHARLARLDESMSGELASVYEEAASQLEKAAVDARKAGVTGGAGAGSTAAKLTVAGAQQSLARLYWTQARGLSSHAATLARLIAAGKTFGESGALEAKLKATESAHDSAVDQAKTAITSARESLDQITSQSEAAAVESIKSNLGTLLASLEGKQVDWSALSSGSAGPSATPGAPAAGRSAAAADNTPEAFLDSIKKLVLSKSGDMKRFFGLVHSGNPAAKSYFQSIVDFSEARANFIAALDSAFGRLHSDPSMPGLPGDLPAAGFTGAKINSKTTDRATVSYSTPDSPDKRTFDLVKVGDRWFVDADSMDTLTQGDVDAMAQKMAMRVGATNSITERVTAGEFPSETEAIAAYRDALKDALGFKTPDADQASPPAAMDK